MKIIYPIICFIVVVVMGLLMGLLSSSESTSLIVLEACIFCIALFLTILLTDYYFKNK